MDEAGAIRSLRAGGGVLAVFAAIIAALEDKGSVTGCPLNNLARDMALMDPDFGTEVDRIFKRWCAALSRKIRSDGMPAGKADPEDAAMFIVSAYSGAMAMARAAQDPEPLKSCMVQVERYMDCLGIR
ncbi:TetR family transcriptional regulator C-terminal domain-containing protein [Roseibium salinum]|nr:TetR family transcriptional regulator C-terminal domain-containing protein [Roseibium salinum]